MKKTFLIAACLCVCLPQLFSQNAREIIEKAEEKMRGVTSSVSEMSIAIERPKWTRNIEMKTWQKGKNYSMVLITAPAREKGTAFLKRNREVWSYMPSVERAVKMPPSMMMRSWMGTDFTNDDLVKESSKADNYEQTIVGDSTILGRSCYKIRLIPKPGAAVVWGKIILFIDKKDYIEMRSEMYDEDGYLVNIMNSSGVRMMGGRLLATKMTLIPVEKKGQRTVLTIKSIQFDKPIDEHFFSVQKMKRLLMDNQ